MKIVRTQVGRRRKNYFQTVFAQKMVGRFLDRNHFIAYAA